MEALTSHRMSVLIEAVKQKHAMSFNAGGPNFSEDVNSFKEPQKPRTQPCKKGYKLDKTGKKCVKA